MNSKKIKIKWFTISTVMAALMLIAISLPASAASMPWITVASAGTVDEDDISKVDLGGYFWDLYGPYVMLKKTATGDVRVRYNILPMNGLFNGYDQSLQVRFLDNTSKARILVDIVEFNLSTGSQHGIMRFDSNSYSPSNNWRTKVVNTCLNYYYFNFDKNAYYAEAHIIKANATDLAGLASIRLSTYSCIK